MKIKKILSKDASIYKTLYKMQIKQFSVGDNNLQSKKFITYYGENLELRTLIVRLPRAQDGFLAGGRPVGQICLQKASASRLDCGTDSGDPVRELLPSSLA